MVSKLKMNNGKIISKVEFNSINFFITKLISDDGNLKSGDCCGSNCQFDPPSVICRASAGVCDLPEYCNGVGLCPNDTLMNSTTICRPSNGPCDGMLSIFWCPLISNSC